VPQSQPPYVIAGPAGVPLRPCQPTGKESAIVRDFVEILGLPWEFLVSASETPVYLTDW
jgi:hypothetical protein